MKWSIAHRLGVLVALAVLASLAVTAMQLGELRSSIYAEREKALRAQVQMAVAMASGQRRGRVVECGGREGENRDSA